jgi:hypothetical protein
LEPAITAPPAARFALRLLASGQLPPLLVLLLLFLLALLQLLLPWLRHLLLLPQRRQPRRK